MTRQKRGPVLLTADGQTRRLNTRNSLPADTPAFRSELATRWREALRMGGLDATPETLAQAFAAAVPSYRCTFHNAEVLSTIPPLVVRKGTDEPVDWHPLQAFTDNAPELLFLLSCSLDIWGRWYLRKKRNPHINPETGKRYPSELEWINPADVEVIPNNDGGVRGYVIGDGREIIPPEDMITDALFSPLHTGRPLTSSYDIGLSPLEVVLTHVTTDKNIATFAAAFFFNGSRLEGILSIGDDGEVEPEDLDKAKQDWRELFRGVGNFFKTFISSRRWTWTPIQPNPVDLAMAELKNLTREDICAAFGVNPALLGYSKAADALSAQSTERELERAHMRNRAKPRFELICAALNEQWAWTEFDPLNSFTLVPDVSSVELLSAVTGVNVTHTTTLSEGHLLDWDEGRERLGYAPREDGLLRYDPTLPLQVWQGSMITFNEFRRMIGQPPFGLTGEVIRLPSGEIVPLSRLWEIAEANAQAMIRPLAAAPSLFSTLPSLPGVDGNGNGGSNGTDITIADAAAPLALPASTDDTENTSAVDTETEASTNRAAPEPAIEIEPDGELEAARKELTNWQHKTRRRGPAVDFETRALPADVTAYTRLLLATSVGELMDLSAVFDLARREFNLHYGKTRSISNTSLGLRAALLDLVRRAFDETGLRNGEPLLSRQQFGELGREEIDAASRQAFLDGKRDGGSSDGLTDKDRERLTPHIRQQRVYFTGFANDVYRTMLPVFLEALDLQRQAREQGTSQEQRAALQRQAIEKYAEFVRLQQEAEARADLYIFAGLQQIYEVGKLSAQAGQRKRFRLGSTDEHCESCRAADGQVHTSEEWLDAGVYPQSKLLECSGIKCACFFEDTDEEISGDLSAVPLNATRSVPTVPGWELEPGEFEDVPVLAEVTQGTS